MVMDSGLSTINPPLSVYRDSSLEMAKIVRPIMALSVCAGIFTLPLAGNVGSPGKLARAMPTILVFERPERMLTQ